MLRGQWSGVAGWLLKLDNAQDASQTQAGTSAKSGWIESARYFLQTATKKLGLDKPVAHLPGGWSLVLPEAFCKLECEAPPAVANAKLLVPRCLQGSHDVGAVCRYKCKPGYQVAENTADKPKK
ncbi:unnamed protein product [Coccothraustes coccothraustes]